MSARELRTFGIESAHALAGAMAVGREIAAERGVERAAGAVLLVNLSGRGDKDMHTAAAYFGFLGQDER